MKPLVRIGVILGSIIVLALIAIALHIIVSFVSFPQASSPEIIKNTIIIIGITQFLTILVLLCLIWFFGGESIKNWIIFIQGLRILKREDVQKSILELKELPKVANLLTMEIINKLKIVTHYEQYTKEKVANSLWVLGSSLSKPETVKEALDKKTLCEYLCPGNIITIKERAQAIIDCLGEKAHEYINAGRVKIYYIGREHVQFPRNIYNPNENDAEVLIRFPRNIESEIGKYAILVKNKEAVQHWKDEYNEIKEKWQRKKNETNGQMEDTEILKELITKV